MKTTDYDRVEQLEDTYRYRCPDCGRADGERHRGGCDVARCEIVDNQQRLSCPDRDDHHCGYDRWTGYWPDFIQNRVLHRSAPV